MQISGSQGTTPETKMSAFGTNPTEVAFCLVHIVFKTFFFWGGGPVSQRGETITEQRGFKSCNYQMDVCILFSRTTKPTLVLVLEALNMVLRKLLVFRYDNGIHTSNTTKCLRFTLKYTSKKKTKIRGDR